MGTSKLGLCEKSLKFIVKDLKFIEKALKFIVKDPKFVLKATQFGNIKQDTKQCWYDWR